MLPRQLSDHEHDAGDSGVRASSAELHLADLNARQKSSWRRCRTGLPALDVGVTSEPPDVFRRSPMSFEAHEDAVILGRRSYEEWAQFWPGSDIEPFASFINAVPKYVATSTPLEHGWASSHAIDGGLVDFVQDLKGRSGGDIGVHGSISVTRALLAAGVVDELRLVIAPTVAASGQRLFDGLPPVRLETIRGSVTPRGHVLVEYRVAR